MISHRLGASKKSDVKTETFCGLFKLKRYRLKWQGTPAVFALSYVVFASIRTWQEEGTHRKLKQVHTAMYVCMFIMCARMWCIRFPGTIYVPQKTQCYHPAIESATLHWWDSSHKQQLWVVSLIVPEKVSRNDIIW